MAEPPLVTSPGSHPTASAATSLPALALAVGLGLALLGGQAGHGFGPVGSLLAVAVWLAAWTLAVVGAGRPLIRRLRGDNEESAEDLVLAAALGATVLVAAAAALSVVGWFRPWPLLAVLIGLAVVGALDLARRPIAAPELGWWGVGLLALWLVPLVIAATVTTFYDQWHQHLGFPWLWLQSGHIHVIPRNFYSYMPVNSSLLYAYGLDSLGAWSAQVVHWWTGAATVIACGLMGRRLAGARAGWWAATVVATTPTALHVAASGGSDLVVTFFAAAAWLALLRTTDDGIEGPLRWWLLAGALAGMAAGTKYTALGTVGIPLAFGALVLHRPDRSLSTWRPLLAGASTAAGGALLTFGPWVVRNLATAGAPFFPFLAGPFRGMLRSDPEAVARFGDWISGFDLSLSHVADGIGLGTWAPPVGGFAPAGLLWLGAGLAAVLALPWLRRPAASALAAGAIAGIAFWLVGLHVVRYLLPALVPAAAVIGGGLAVALGAAGMPIRRALTFLVAAAVAWNLSTTLHPVGFQRLGCSLGVEPVEPLLARWVSSSLAFDAVRELPEEAKILLVAESRALGFEREVEIEHPFGESRLEEVARLQDSPQAMAAALAGEGFTHVLSNRWEARRIASMRNRPRYFVHGDPAAMARLDAFARRCLEPEWLGNGVAVYRLDPGCASSGAGDLASW